MIFKQTPERGEVESRGANWGKREQQVQGPRGGVTPSLFKEQQRQCVGTSDRESSREECACGSGQVGRSADRG